MMTQSDRSAVVLDTNVVSILYERDSPGHEFTTRACVIGVSLCRS